MDGLFGPDDIIHVYDDTQALADGTLVDLPSLGIELRFHGGLVNRMSRALFEELRPYIEASGGADALAKILRTKLQYAVDTAGAGEERNYLYELPGGGRPDDPIWLIRNETGGWTVMFSSDY